MPNAGYEVPIHMRLKDKTSSQSAQELPCAGGTETYKAALVPVAEWFGGKPLPHECTRAPVIHGRDEAVDIVIDFHSSQ